MNIKHSKYKNTGIIFELLVRQITADTLSGKNSKAASVLKKFFVKTELGKEYKLFDTVIKNNSEFRLLYKSRPINYLPKNKDFTSKIKIRIVLLTK